MALMGVFINIRVHLEVVFYYIYIYICPYFDLNYTIISVNLVKMSSMFYAKIAAGVLSFSKHLFLKAIMFKTIYFHRKRNAKFILMIK